ncbi:hypothetical protein BKA80DRAFT_272278 [Phyllosticta citrichinensis]
MAAVDMNLVWPESCAALAVISCVAFFHGCAALRCWCAARKKTPCCWPSESTPPAISCSLPSLSLNKLCAVSRSF